MDKKNINRPSVLETASETQIEELERHFAEQDREGWNMLTGRYEWSSICKQLREKGQVQVHR